MLDEHEARAQWRRLMLGCLTALCAAFATACLLFTLGRALGVL